MQASRCLFGNPDKETLYGFHFPFGKDCRRRLKPNEVGIFLSRRGKRRSDELEGEVTSPRDHEGVLVVFSRKLLQSLLDPFRPGLDPELRSLIEQEAGAAVFEPNLSPEISTRLQIDFVSPPLQGAAQSFFLEAKTKELIAHVGFLPGKDSQEFFCSRQKRMNSDRVVRCMEHLRQHLDEPLDLGAVAELVGCSPSYLSRIFSSTTGLTISQFFRKCRIEKAAEMLVTGHYLVSEVAIEVGYQSLSHFSKAFQTEKGCLPSQFEAA